ncbi:MutS-related protein [Butyrivibrio sp. YAB3001]|uniref:MutS-related protein n=1 Tax=Butyrivibrio sp. YAB3001 TaxID=1520812 RepID=UPI0008F671B9|nr:DNA mismatch repair protein [Butyrivibrio sp. YAB3001]SFB75912.1 MutS domain V [Butyrivibrio sp. YAB3001]
MGEKISLLFPDQTLNFKTLSDITIHDIGMDVIVKKLSTLENERIYIMNVMKMMAADPFNAGYRADVFDDIYKNKKMRDTLLKLFDRINFLREFGSFKRDHEHEPGVWDLLHRLEEIRDYIECIEAIHACLAETDIHSEGLNRLRDYVNHIYEDNALDALKKDIKDLKANTGNLKSVTVGINLNERFEATDLGVISINSKPFSKSHIVSHFIDKVTGDSINKDADWDGSYRFDEFTIKGKITNDKDFVIPAFSPLALMSLRHIPEGEESERGITNYMDEVAGRLLSKTVRHLREVLGKYAMLAITDITDLMPEFIYYIRWAEFIEKLSEKGFLFCKPEICKEADTSLAMDAKGVYNLKLIENGGISFSDIVLNSLRFTDDLWLYILTGANRGGKTTITQAIGQLYFLAQGGIYVPGISFSYRPVDAIYTHFPADEDKTLDLGRLGEECKRFKDMYDNATKDSLFLLNETFSTTSFEEGFFIAKDCIKAILQKGIRTIYNTHMHKLAYDIDEINADASKFKAASLIVLNQGSERSYSIKVAPPEGMSYANDIAKRYGVTFDMLTEGK